MLQPILDYNLRGAIWYQGENNAIGPESVEYYELFPAFITDLREQLGKPELPFVFVQLPDFAKNSDTFWNYPIVRDAQLKAFQALDHVGMAITTDIGDPKDIHPRNKLDVGLRLARWALSQTYGQEGLVPTGPIFDKARFDAGQVQVSFQTWGSELRAKGGVDLGGFVLAGEDQVFHPAVARIVDGSVVVQSELVAAPKALRYGWGNDPADATLINAEGLPASPFRTDDWKLP
jgi:sialate O-acetylesterase